MTVNGENSLSPPQSATEFKEIPLQEFNSLEEEIVFWKTLYVVVWMINIILDERDRKTLNYLLHRALQFKKKYEELLNQIAKEKKVFDS